MVCNNAVGFRFISLFQNPRADDQSNNITDLLSVFLLITVGTLVLVAVLGGCVDSSLN